MSCCRLCPHCVLCCAQSCLILCNSMDGSPPDSSFLEFSKQEYWSGLPFPTPEDLPDPGIKLASTVSPAFQVDSLPTEPPGKPSLLLHKTSLWGVLPLHQAECSCCSQFQNQLWKFHIYYSNSIEENCRAYRRQICFCLPRTFFFFLSGNSILIFLGTHPFLSIWTFGTTFHALPCLKIGMWYKLSQLDSFLLANLNVERRDGREGKMIGASLTG